MAKLAFIGLGVMGYPMAGHLQAAGHDVTVYNRTATKAHAWQKNFGGKFALTPKSAAYEADIVFTCVGNDDDLRQVVLGEDGILAGLAPNAILVDHSTISAALAREMGVQLQAKACHFVDAPVSGGQVGAEKGALTIMCGASDGVFERIEPVIAAYARFATRIGDIGAGQLAKMVNQICIAGVLQGLAEGIHFGEQAGLDMAKVLAVISKGAAQSWQMEQRGSTMVEKKFDFGFAVDWMRKDLGLVLDEARKNQARLPLTALVDQFYADLQASGANRYDTSALILRLQSRHDVI